MRKIGGKSPPVFEWEVFAGRFCCEVEFGPATLSGRMDLGILYHEIFPHKKKKHDIVLALP